MPNLNPPDVGGSAYTASNSSAPQDAKPVASKPGDQAYAVAQQQLNKPYVYGATGPDSFDCSGLMMYSYAQGPHLQIGRDTSAQWNNQTSLSTFYDALQPLPGQPSATDLPNQLEVGDLALYFQPGNSGENAHVRMFAGGGQMIEAPYTGANVRMVPLDLQGDASEPFRGIKRATGGGSQAGAAGSAAGGGSGSGTGSGANSIANNPGKADAGFVDQPLTDPRNNLPFSAAFQGIAGFRYVGPKIGSRGAAQSTVLTNMKLVRGGIVQLMTQGDNSAMKAQKGGQFACYFMMNPSSVGTDCTINTDVASPSQQSAAAMQAAPSWMAQQTISFTLIFNRMYEVWQGTVKGPNGGPGPSDIGVRWDIRAVERLMGMFDAQALNTPKGVNNVGLGVSGAGSSPPSSLPVQVVLGGPNSIQFQGYIGSMSYTYTMFDANMIPIEASVDISILRQYLPSLSSADLVNPLVTQVGYLGSVTFPYSPKSTFNSKSGVVQINKPGGISL